MSDLEIDASIYNRAEHRNGLSNDVIDLATAAEDLGFDGVWSSETDCDAFLPLPLMAEHTDDIEIGTRIALSFTRSPMVLAYLCWDLARYSNGRFTLGLGTQVKGHNERRFDVEFESPGPRLRDVILALRHIWDVFQGEEDELDYDGAFHSFSLMTPFFNPGPIDHPDIPIHIAGVNEYNLRLAGELADGLAMHTFNTPEYIDEVIVPAVEEGCERGNRSIDDVELIANPLTITGRDEDEMEAAREHVREQIAFYGSTRTYHDVLALHGLKDVGQELHERSKQGEWKEMDEVVTDDIVDTFAIEAPIDELGDEIHRTYGNVVDRVLLSYDFDGEEYWRTVVEDVHTGE